MLTMRSLTKDEIIINFFWRRRSRAMLSEIHKPTVKICSQTESPHFFLPDPLGFFRKEDSFVRAPSHKTYGALTSLKWGFQRGLSSQEYPEVWSNWGQLHFILFPVWRSLDEEVQIVGKNLKQRWKSDYLWIWPQSGDPIAVVHTFLILQWWRVLSWHYPRLISGPWRRFGNPVWKQTPGFSS